MRKISILYIVSLAIMTAIIIYSYTNRAEIAQHIATPQPTQDIEKQQLMEQLHEAQRESQYYYTAYRSIKKDWEKYFAPSQVEYMKRRAK